MKGKAEKHKMKAKGQIQMKETQPKSIPPLPLETTSSSMIVMGESSLMP
jgi:hypothetical protein